MNVAGSERRSETRRPGDQVGSLCALLGLPDEILIGSSADCSMSEKPDLFGTCNLAALI
jgi:hypothetical protein